MVLAVVVVAALVVRIAYAFADVPDFWGDSYHGWLIERLTLDHGWIYSDYKGREAVWFPLSRYLGAAAMFVSGRADLLPAHVLNLFLGAVACGAAALLATRLTASRLWGAVAGMTLAATPWHVAYSWMDMPEVTGGLIVLLAVLAAGSRKWAWGLAVLGLLGALTRMDAVYLLLLFGAWLALHGARARAALLWGGVAGGLGAWSAWVASVTGDPLWWMGVRRLGSTADAAFWLSRGVRPRAGLVTLGAAALQAYAPLIVVAVVAGYLLARRTRVGGVAMRRRAGPTGVPAPTTETPARETPRLEPRLRALRLAPLFLAAAHLVIVAIMQRRYFSYPDPRYLLVSVPLMAVASAVVLSSLRSTRAVRGATVAHVAIVALSLATQLPTFPFRSLTLERERMVGRFLGGLRGTSGRLWVDAPVTIYYSGIDPHRFRSSDQLVGMPTSPYVSDTAEHTGGARGAAVRALMREDVRYVLWEEAPYTRVPEIWPEMARGRRFEADGFTFAPVFRYEPFRAGPEAPWPDRVRQRIEARYSPAVLWRVSRHATEST